MPKPIISWTIGAVAVTMLGAGLLTAAQAVDTSPEPQVVLTSTRRGADDHPRATSTTVVATTPTSIDDHGVDAPATHDVGEDHGLDDPAPPDLGDDRGGDDRGGRRGDTPVSTTVPTVDDHGVDDHGADDPATPDVGDDHGRDGTTVSTTLTTIDDHGGISGSGTDDPATHDVGDDHGGTSGGHGSDG